MHAMYHELTPWYALLDPPENHELEAEQFCKLLLSEMSHPPKVPCLLELGSGAGHNAVWMKNRFDCTLSDISNSMLELSRKTNPECEHHQGDMQSLDLGRQFDAVLIHDAIVYMASEPALKAALANAFRHVRPGGSAIFAPDSVRESFQEQTELEEAQEGNRALRCTIWSWDEDPTDCTVQVEYGFLLREGKKVRLVHDRHTEGLFSVPDWLRILQEVGFEVRTEPRSIGAEFGSEASAYYDQMFVCHRPKM